MVLKGYKHPLVQEDLWDLQEEESTANISQRFNYHMQTELGAARVRFQSMLKKKPVKSRSKGPEEASQNGLPSGLGKGVSQDALMMVRACIEKHSYTG